MNILHALTSDAIEFYTAKMWGGGPALYERDLLLPPISLMSELGSTTPSMSHRKVLAKNRKARESADKQQCSPG